LLRPVDFAIGEQAVVQNVVNVEMRVNDHADVIGVQTPFRQGIDQAVCLVMHARIDNDVMMAMRK